jgi:ankyrin repeat protein
VVTYCYLSYLSLCILQLFSNHIRRLGPRKYDVPASILIFDDEIGDSVDTVLGLDSFRLSANYPVRLFDLHLMLNERVNPNMRDPEDLHYASMHWAARNFSTIAMKMLRHAGADINIRNELDQTPLTMCVIVKQTDRRKYQLKALKYMIEEGAEINTRDKAGFGPVVNNSIIS